MNHFFSITILSLFLSFSANAEEGIKVGLQAPQIKTQDTNGNTFDLKKSLKKGPVVLVFYRGGWCPYCNLQLRSLQLEVLPAVKKQNAELVVISVDRLDESLKTIKQEKLGMTVLSDSRAKILKKYKVAYKVPKELVSKYKIKYKIDLEKSSGRKHHIIAKPAVYVIDQKGTVTFSYVGIDYKTRAQNKDILTALKKLK